MPTVLVFLPLGNAVQLPKNQSQALSILQGKEAAKFEFEQALISGEYFWRV